MRTVVLENDVLEGDVKPHDLLDQYRHLVERDVVDLLVKKGQLVTRNCPGCKSANGKNAFVRSELTYFCCEDCGCLYISPCPDENSLADFYKNSEAASFWRSQLLPATRTARLEKLFRPRVEWLLDVVDEYRPDAQRAVAVGYHNELFIEELSRQEGQNLQIIVTNPIADIEYEGLNLPHVEVRPQAVGTAIDVDTDLFFAFDILDRCTDSEGFMVSARNALVAGGIMLGTTTLGSGFDIQVLWDKSESAYLPDRLNLFSSEGLAMLFERHGFEILEFSTPGMFDVDVVRNAVIARPDEDWPRFIRYLVEKRDDETMEALQEFLQRFRMSSFARFALRKID
jgi:hypothetical protein